jgi:hypothetical protein
MMATPAFTHPQLHLPLFAEAFKVLKIKSPDRRHCRRFRLLRRRYHHGHRRRHHHRRRRRLREGKN